MLPGDPPRVGTGWTRRAVLALLQALIATPLLGRLAAARPMPRPPADAGRVFEEGVFERGVFE